jgi:hypothetical protein
MPKLPKTSSEWLQLIKVHEFSESNARDMKIVQALARFYLSVTAGQRSTIRSRVTLLLSNALFAFSKTTAEDGVREKNRDRLLEGLTALALGVNMADYRDTIVAFSLLAHSARKIKVDVEDVFNCAVDWADDFFRDQVRDFLARDREEQSIYVMGYKETGRGKQFAYVRDRDY